MASDGDATVTASQPWAEDGEALVVPLPPFEERDPRTLDLDNRSAGSHTVSKADHPGGLVIVVAGNEPSTNPAILPIWASADDEVQVTGDNYVEWPDGFVIWFLTS